MSKIVLVAQMALYEEVVRLLDRGRQWELAVELVQELVREQGARGAGYGALAALHEQLARLYRAPLLHPRPRLAYFRVRYLGRGFPPHLRHPKVCVLADMCADRYVC